MHHYQGSYFREEVNIMILIYFYLIIQKHCLLP